METLPIGEFDNNTVKVKKGQFSFAFARQQTKHSFEFQEVCEDLARDFGKGVWQLPYKKGFTEFKLKEAGRIARQRGVLKLGYLIGIVKKL